MKSSPMRRYFRSSILHLRFSFQDPFLLRRMTPTIATRSRTEDDFKRQQVIGETAVCQASATVSPSVVGAGKSAPGRAASRERTNKATMAATRRQTGNQARQLGPDDVFLLQVEQHDDEQESAPSQRRHRQSPARRRGRMRATERTIRRVRQSSAPEHRAVHGIATEWIRPPTTRRRSCVAAAKA